MVVRKVKVAKKSDKKTLKAWCVSHKKALLITFYLVAAIVIPTNTLIILDTITVNETVEKEEAIPFRTEYVSDNTIELGIEQTEREGQDGVKKIYVSENKKLISKKVLDSHIDSSETITEPVSKIIHRGTRKWQFMYCSDGTWRYFTDEIFSDPNIGFTHSSEDYCASNNHGTAIGLADVPPSPNASVSAYSNSGSRSSRSNLTESYVELMEQIAEYERELKNNQPSSTPTNQYEGTSTSDPTANERARQEAEQRARQATENTCRQKAEQARDSARRQLGAAGVGGSQLTTVPQSAYDSTYNSCMSGYGY